MQPLRRGCIRHQVLQVLGAAADNTPVYKILHPHAVGVPCGDVREANSAGRGKNAQQLFQQPRGSTILEVIKQSAGDNDVEQRRVTKGTKGVENVSR